MMCTQKKHTRIFERTPLESKTAEIDSLSCLVEGFDTLPIFVVLFLKFGGLKGLLGEGLLGFGVLYCKPNRNKELSLFFFKNCTLCKQSQLTNNNVFNPFGCCSSAQPRLVDACLEQR